ncbi:hypothetical protein ACWCXE_05390 [Streptomyces sp. NPDC001780]
MSKHSFSTATAATTAAAATFAATAARFAVPARFAVVAAVVLTAAGCGATDAGGGTVPEGWGTLKTSSVTVAHPPGFVPQGEKERSRHNAAAATLTEGGEDIGMITVQLDFTDADSAEEAAIGAEAAVALGSTLGEQSAIEVAGPDGPAEARRTEFAFTEKGKRVEGVIVAGLDSAKQTYAVRVDARKGGLGDGDLTKILRSITVT